MIRVPLFPESRYMRFSKLLLLTPRDSYILQYQKGLQVFERIFVGRGSE